MDGGSSTKNNGKGIGKQKKQGNILSCPPHCEKTAPRSFVFLCRSASNISPSPPHEQPHIITAGLFPAQRKSRTANPLLQREVQLHSSQQLNSTVHPSGAPKMKRKISDCYSQSMGWGNLHWGPLGDITKRADILSTARLARGMHGYRRAIAADPSLLFGKPALLHSDPEAWPFDRDNKVLYTR